MIRRKTLAGVAVVSFYQGCDIQGRGAIPIRAPGLHDWLEDYESSKPFEAFWDPRREIRSAIEKDLKLISANKIDWPQLVPNAEWLGQRLEDEIDQVRRQESRQQR